MVFAAAALMTMGALPGREHTVVADAGPEVLRLEADVAAHPADLSLRTELAQTYLDARSPGLAWRVLAETPDTERSEPVVQHLAARVLIEQGKAGEALAMERSVLSTCTEDGAVERTREGCNFWLIVSATRRADILEELVTSGVDDAIAHPEASLVAYHKATHEARLAIAE
jgi:hypothetical protein